MYDFLLSIHNIARWLVLLAAIYLLYRQAFIIYTPLANDTRAWD